jgi:hypothetical protein
MHEENSFSMTELSHALVAEPGFISPCKYRVKIFTLAGTQVGIIGVGENLPRGDERLTFPAHMGVANILKYEQHNWIRRATEEELINDPTWYRPAPFRPACFVFIDGSFAQHFQCIGLRGDTVTAMEMSASTAMDDNISTPPTPSSGTYGD